MTPLIKPDLDLLKDQKLARRLMGAFLASGRLPHALLFSGIGGSGKKAAAVAFAMACNCRAAEAKEMRASGKALWNGLPCGDCAPCRKILSGNHPDILVVDAGGNTIKIERIRRLCQDLSLKPYEGDRRIAVILDAPRMTPEAANALLKVLEEPPPETLLILTAAQRSDLLPTLASRCHPVNFHPLPEGRIAAILERRCGISADAAATLAAMAHGSLSRALALADSPADAAEWQHRREVVFSAAGLDHPDARISQPLTVALVFAERLSLEKAGIPETLEILQSLLRDTMVLHWRSGHVFNKDLIEKLQYASQHIHPDVLLAQMTAVQHAERDLTANVNPRLVLEKLMIELRDACDEKDRRHPL